VLARRHLGLQSGWRISSIVGALIVLWAYLAIAGRRKRTVV